MDEYIRKLGIEFIERVWESGREAGRSEDKTDSGEAEDLKDKIDYISSLYAGTDDFRIKEIIEYLNSDKHFQIQGHKMDPEYPL